MMIPKLTRMSGRFFDAPIGLISDSRQVDRAKSLARRGMLTCFSTFYPTSSSARLLVLVGLIATLLLD